MKKVLFIIAIALVSYTNYAQSSVFDKFEDMEEVSSVVVSKSAFRMLGKFSGDNEEVKMLANLESLKVFTAEDPAVIKKMKATIDSYLKNSKLTELMRVNDKGSNIKIYVREGKDEDHVKELLMFVNGLSKVTGNNNMNINGMKPEAVILSLTGNIDLNKISSLIEPHISGSGDQLKKKH
ncbi:MAG: hypothetical protein COB60_11220 [Flavobacteriaceae bacterium]|nr:MAG: hypothetical protein COB60_11220 [Flavobacteriaceae bacterium]